MSRPTSRVLNSRTYFCILIAHGTLEFITDTMLLYNQWLCFMHLEFLVNFAAQKHGLDIVVHFEAEVLSCFLTIPTRKCL